MSIMDSILGLGLVIVAIVAFRAKRLAMATFDATEGSPTTRFEEGETHFLLPGLAVGVVGLLWLVGVGLVLLGDPSIARLAAYAAYVFVLGGIYSLFHSTYRAYARGKVTTTMAMARFFLQNWTVRLVPNLLVVGAVYVALKSLDSAGQVAQALIVILAAAVGVSIAFAIYPTLTRVLSGARPLKNSEILTELAVLNQMAGTKVTRLYVVPSPDVSVNALAMGLGRKRSSIFLTQTLMDQLSASDVRSILAHELAHIRQGHILKSLAESIVAVGVRVVLITAIWSLLDDSARPIVFFAAMFGVYVLVEVGASLPFARQREREADDLAAKWVGSEALGEALEKLYAADLDDATDSKVEELCQTHPALASRLRRLRTA